jgi:serine/threonine-protein kinase
MATGRKQNNDGDVIALEPTISPEAGSVPPPSGQGRVDLVVGAGESLTTETHTLRRKRLGYAAVFLAIFYGVLSLWNVLTRESVLWYIAPPFALRFLLAALVAGVVLSRITLSAAAVKALELTLFGGLTALLCWAQYFINLEFIRQGHLMGAVAYSKNGVIQLVVLMVLYGMVIPNNARSAASVVLSMALALMTTFILLIDHPALTPIFAALNQAEPIATDLVYIFVSAGLAIYGAHVLNGLRSELHTARRFGQYQLGRRLGTGGMGEVYLAEHQMLKRPCALKLIRPDASTNPIALARFEREVQSAARLSHPNTVEIFDYGHSSDGTFYYVMEFLPGLSLEELVKQFGPVPPGRLVYLLRQVCAGLAEAHSLGLVHRDLKPGNIYVALRGGESDVAKVLDFGLVKLTHDPTAPQLTADQTVSGTPLYMSPEQARGESELDHRCDMYSLGAIAYFALTGQPPFVGDTAMSIMIAHVRDPVVPPSKLRPDLPGDVEEVILKSLAKNPDDRYSDVKAMGKALAECSCASEWDAERADGWWIEAARAMAQEVGA